MRPSVRRLATVGNNICQSDARNERRQRQCSLRMAHQQIAVFLYNRWTKLITRVWSSYTRAYKYELAFVIYLALESNIILINLENRGETVLQNVKNFRARNRKWDITRWIFINSFISQCNSDLMLVEPSYCNDYKYHQRHIFVCIIYYPATTAALCVN
jgi:hypothetical protein